MEFKKYNSIENSYRTKIVNEIYNMGWEKLEWVVSEKIHGANFAFYLNPDGVRCAKRSGMLGVGEKFFEWESVVDAYDEQLHSLYRMANIFVKEAADVEGDVEVILYGELFGGSYPHPEVEKDPIAMKVQKGIYYAPWNDFYAFDMKINGRFLSYDIFAEFMEMVGFHYAKALYRGTLKECLAYPNDFPTKLPEKLGLPAIDNNIAEGVVIKPVHTLYFDNGNRVILKNKNEKYKEVKEKKEKHVPDLSLSEEEKVLFEEARKYVTENRLRNVISKIGEITDKKFGILLGSFNKDILEDWRKDFEGEIAKLDKKRLKVIQKNIQKEAKELMVGNFVNIIDGEF